MSSSIVTVCAKERVLVDLANFTGLEQDLHVCSLYTLLYTTSGHNELVPAELKVLTNEQQVAVQWEQPGTDLVCWVPVGAYPAGP